MVQKIHLNIAGMTCVNCEYKIRKMVSSADGVSRAAANYNRGTADIVYEDTRISREQIIALIEKLDYRVIQSGKAAAPHFANVAAILAVIVVLFVLLQSHGILNKLTPGQLADTGMGYGMLFITGLFTSVHCVAMCGGINLSQSLLSSGKNGAAGNGGAHFLPAAAYNLGRVCSYTAAGFLFGLAGMLAGGGSGVGISAFLQGILKIAAGLVMAVM